MQNNSSNKCVIDEQISQLRNKLEHNRNLVAKYLSEVQSLKKDLFFLLDLRKSFFPEQYTKYGILRKKYKGNI